MKPIKHVTLAGAVSASLLIAGCGGSSGGSSDSASGSTSGTGSSGTEISGTVTAPAGTVAYLENPGILHLAMDFLVPSAAAAITGLEPVEGAVVELIRVDNDGNPIGDALATASTSITGDYSLTLPTGVSLAGDLVVRITGQNDSQLRAQVVEEEVDISPVSEFVLQKFIQQGATLSTLAPGEVVHLSGRVEEFDLTLDDSANLEGAFAILEEAVGDFLENEVAVVANGDGDAADIAGTYQSVALSFELHDDDNSNWGDYLTALTLADFTFTASGNEVSISLGTEESGRAGVTGVAMKQGSIYYETDVEDVDETLTGITYTDNGILSVTGSFEEEIEDGFAWRYPAVTYNLQQVADKGIFFQVSNEAAVRYGLDPETGALDPDKKEGDEVFRTLEVFLRQPTDFRDEELKGTFGLITLTSRLNIADSIEKVEAELEYEAASVTFKGDGTLDYNGGDYYFIHMDPERNSDYSEETEEADPGLTVEIDESGIISSIGGETVDGFVNDTADFIILAGTEGSNGSEAETTITLMVKQPDSTPSISGNIYRLLLLSQTLGDGEDFQLTSSRFNTFVTMTSETTGSTSGSTLLVERSGLGGNLETEVEDIGGALLTASIAADKATLTIADDDGTATLEGFFNEDASLGIFGFRYADTGSDPEELGLAVLVKVTQ